MLNKKLRVEVCVEQVQDFYVCVEQCIKQVVD